VMAWERGCREGGTRVRRALMSTTRRQRGWTRWSVVYELGSLRAHFRTEDRAVIRRIDLSVFDLACSAPVKMLDVDARLEGDVAARFTTYSTAANLDLVKRSFRKTPFLAQTPDSRLEAFARHPDRARCTTAEVGGAR